MKHEKFNYKTLEEVKEKAKELAVHLPSINVNKGQCRSI